MRSLGTKYFRASWIFGTLAVLAVLLSLAGPLLSSGPVDSIADWASIVALPFTALAAYLATSTNQRKFGDEAPENQDTWIRVIRQKAREEIIGNIGLLRELPGGIRLAAEIDLEFRCEGDSPQGGRVLALEEVPDYFRGLRSKRLVIVGGPGSGKTLSALRIADALSDSSRTAEAVPVPIWLSSGSYRGQASLNDWIVFECMARYRVPEDVVRALLISGRLLAFVDGIDEAVVGVDGLERARAIVSLINDHREGATRGAVVSTIRTATVGSLNNARFLDSTSLDLLPLTVGQVLAYIEDSVADDGELAQWEAVVERLRALPEDQLIRESSPALATPWLLTTATAAAINGHAPIELADFEPADPEAGVDRLVDTFLESVVSVRQGKGVGLFKYSAPSIRRVLALFSRGLHERGEDGGSPTDIVLHELWLLAGPRRVQVVHLLVAVAATSALVIAAVFLGVLGVPLSSWIQLVGVIAALAIPALLKVRYDKKAPPVHPRYREILRYREGQLSVSLALCLGLAAAQLGAQAVVSADSAILAGVVSGICAGLAYGGLLGFMLRRTGMALLGSIEPRDPFRSTVRPAALIAAVCAILSGVVALSEVGPRPSALYAILFAIAFAIINGLPIGSVAWQRYLIAIVMLAPSGQLPPLPRRFLEWCTKVTIMRTAGIAYQFRHQELQKRLEQS